MTTKNQENENLCANVRAVVDAIGWSGLRFHHQELWALWQARVKNGRKYTEAVIDQD